MLCRHIMIILNVPIKIYMEVKKRPLYLAEFIEKENKSVPNNEPTESKKNPGRITKKKQRQHMVGNQDHHQHTTVH